jgi:twinkle protein
MHYSRETDSRIVEQHIPCPCGKSSDAYCTYDDGHGFCFSCYKPFGQKGANLAQEDDGLFTYEYVAHSGISRETMQKYDVLTKVDATGRPVALGFKYANEATQIKDISKGETRATGATFRSQGEISQAGLFGKERFPPGSAKAVTISEGAKDALSVYELLGQKYPSVSIQSSGSARRDCSIDRDYLNSFEKIYICIEDDQPGRKAVKDIAALFDFNKVYHVKLSGFGLKDANDFLRAGKVEDFRRVWWNAQRFMPEGIVSSYSQIENILKNSRRKEGIPYPFPTLQEMTGGMRTGEVTIWKADEGVGKTEIIRTAELALSLATDDPIGIIHLEENKDENVKRLVGRFVGAPCHKPDAGYSDDEVLDQFKKLSKRDDRLHFYSHFGSDDPKAIEDMVRFLVASVGCKWITLDPIQHAVAGLSDKEKTSALDYLATRFELMTLELDFGMHIAAHVNDDGKARDSRMITKAAHTVIHINRDHTNENDNIRNTSHLVIQKNRPWSRTGPAGMVYFDEGTFSLREFKAKEVPV